MGAVGSRSGRQHGKEAARAGGCGRERYRERDALVVGGSGIVRKKDTMGVGGSRVSGVGRGAVRARK